MSLIRRIKCTLAGLLAAASLWTAPVLAAGTTPLSLVQQFDTTGSPLAGCLLYFYVAGTVATPQNAFQDFGLSTPLPNPVTCDQSGRVPQHWLADGLIHIRLTDSSGVVQVDTIMQVLGPSSGGGGGGGGGGTVDPTTIASTGDMKFRLDKDAQTGWVRINGLTIGSASSGASERANADTQNLFIYVWTKFSQPSGNVICPVVGGLGASALADFNANKQITLEDARSRALFALDDMGNSALGGFSGVSFSIGSATTGGARGGTNSTTLLPSWIPTITSNGAVTVAPPGSNYMPIMNDAGGGTETVVSTAGTHFAPISGPSGWGYVNSFSGTGSMTSNNTAGLPMPSVPSALLGTLFWKL